MSYRGVVNPPSLRRGKVKGLANSHTACAEVS